MSACNRSWRLARALSALALIAGAWPAIAPAAENIPAPPALPAADEAATTPTAPAGDKAPATPASSSADKAPATRTAPSAGTAAMASPAPGGQIPYELWDRPRSGRAVLALPAVREAIAALAANPSARLLIRHPAEAEGTLQAEELRAWLIAHAVAPGRLVLRPERASRQPLELEILR
jgi:hypothetical protein